MNCRVSTITGDGNLQRRTAWLISTFLFLYLSCLILPGVALADSCDHARTLQGKMDTLTRTIETDKEELQRLERGSGHDSREQDRKGDAAADKYDRLSKKFKELEKERDKLASESKELWWEKQNAQEELRRGLYCDKCKRTKSEIERQEKMPFGKHLENVKGKAIEAPSDLVAAVMNRYERRIEELDRQEKKRSDDIWNMRHELGRADEERKNAEKNREKENTSLGIRKYNLKATISANERNIVNTRSELNVALSNCNTSRSKNDSRKRNDDSVEIIGAGKLSPEARDVLADILWNAGELFENRVSSGMRSPRKQAEVMLQNADAGKRVRYKKQAEPVDRVLDDYLKRKISRSEAVDLMEKRIIQVVEAYGTARETMQHVSGGTNYAFDVTPDSIDDHAEFKRAIEADPRIIRCIYPGELNEPVYHLEIAANNSSRRNGSCRIR